MKLFPFGAGLEAIAFARSHFETRSEAIWLSA
jgi:hypothetical protein